MQAFHVFHTSCLIHWILYCEFEIVRNQTVSTKGGRRSRKKNGTKSNTTGKDGTVNVLPNPIVSVFCPDCQGTGVNIEGDEFEKPLTPLSEVWFLSFVHAIVLFFFFFNVFSLHFASNRELQNFLSS